MSRQGLNDMARDIGAKVLSANLILRESRDLGISVIAQN
jgi:hypothetical protein